MTSLGKLAWGAWIISLLAGSGTAWAQRDSPAPGQRQGAAVVPSVIPIFPLEDATLFPGASHPFHIFEPRYREMIADALKGDRIIGMATLKPGYEADYDGRPPIFAIGCAGLITDVEELPDGRFNVMLQGIAKFRISREDPSRRYRLAHIEVMPETLGDRGMEALGAERRRLKALVTKPGSGSSIPPGIPDEEVVNTLAQYVPVDPPERQTLLELKDALARAQALIKLLEAAGPPPR